MRSYHIHIEGRVQGVGFRPFVYGIARAKSLSGTVANTLEGVDIQINATKDATLRFIDELRRNAPLQALITSINYEEIPHVEFQDFSILDSVSHGNPDLLITPDFAICEDCKRELDDPSNRRYHYPFITCTSCGPRYSIETDLPYDRHLTSMAPYTMCPACEGEFWSTEDRRFYSQTNSCPSCKVNQWVMDAEGNRCSVSDENVIHFVCEKIKAGSIVAVKGIGGFLLLCDADNQQNVQELRIKKNRPSKPFALLFPALKLTEELMEISPGERGALLSHSAPILLLQPKMNSKATKYLPYIAPGLNRLGIMLPYAPLLVLISEEFGRPLLATSGNRRGSPIAYRNEQAIELLSGFADFFLLHDRDIQIPQDDSVVRYSSLKQQKVIIRRSRGLAPGFHQQAIKPAFDQKVLAMGALLKSSIGIWQLGRCHVSQFLGDTTELDSQLSYEKTLVHLQKLLRFVPEVILVDRHPAYFTTLLGKELCLSTGARIREILHHEAHFWAVLGENNLLESQAGVLGVVFDGTGMGNDGAIWGGEFFTFEKGNMSRLNHIFYYPHILGDKMAREPRLSAYSLLHQYDLSKDLMSGRFSESELAYYEKVLDHSTLSTSSMGRVFDAVSSLLGICQFNSYEGEAAMGLETLAARYCEGEGEYPDPYTGMALTDSGLDFGMILTAVLDDLQNEVGKERIAARFHMTIVCMIEDVAKKSGFKSVAFSGGVFQNALLLDMILHKMTSKFKLYFHQDLSPNDECISYGQLVGYYASEVCEEGKENIIHSKSVL